MRANNMSGYEQLAQGRSFYGNNGSENMFIDMDGPRIGRISRVGVSML